MKTDNTPSLRIRYFSLTLILGIVIIAFVLNIYLSLSEKNTLATQALSSIERQTILIEKISSNITDIYRTLNLFLLNPKHKNHIQVINQKLTDSKQVIMDSEFANTRNPDQSSTKETLLNNVESFERYLKKLVTIRSDPNLQYPGMSISANTMAGQQNTIKSLLNILQEEIESGDFEPSNNNLYSEILKTRILVEKEISQSRIYIANRLALFSNEILKSQAASLTDFHNSLLKQLNKMHKIYDNESDSFEGTAVLSQIIDLQSKWYLNFNRLRATSESDRWQQDSLLMEKHVIPLIENSTNLLAKHRQNLRLKKESITEDFKNNSQELFYILTIIIAIFMIYILVILFSLELMIFKPILNIAKVMKAKAFDLSEEKFSTRQSKETNSIITAFNELEKQVKLRTEDIKFALIKATKAKEEATSANAAKSTFLANISHELRTPLHGILSFSELGLSKAENIDTEKAGQYFEVINQSGQRLLFLLNDLLDLARLEAGRTKLHTEENDLYQISSIAIHQLKNSTDEKQIKINIDSDEQKMPAIFDEEKITQVINNLISNSIKYSPEKGNIDINLSTTIIDNEEFAQFTIKDDGIGIPDEELEHIFDKFNESSSTKSGAGGKGLGLAICTEIIKLHQGFIRAEKTAPPGACFVFCIPVQRKITSEEY